MVYYTTLHSRFRSKTEFSKRCRVRPTGEHSRVENELVKFEIYPEVQFWGSTALTADECLSEKLEDLQEGGCITATADETVEIDHASLLAGSN